MFADEGILLDEGGGGFYALNRVGLTIWECCDGEHQVEDIVMVVLARFGVDEATARADVEGFLEELAGEGLVQLLPQNHGA